MGRGRDRDSVEVPPRREMESTPSSTSTQNPAGVSYNELCYLCNCPTSRCTQRRLLCKGYFCTKRKCARKCTLEDHKKKCTRVVHEICVQEAQWPGKIVEAANFICPHCLGECENVIGKDPGCQRNSRGYKARNSKKKVPETTDYLPDARSQPGEAHVLWVQNRVSSQEFQAAVVTAPPGSLETSDPDFAITANRAAVPEPGQNAVSSQALQAAASTASTHSLAAPETNVVMTADGAATVPEITPVQLLAPSGEITAAGHVPLESQTMVSLLDHAKEQRDKAYLGVRQQADAQAAAMKLIQNLPDLPETQLVRYQLRLLVTALNNFFASQLDKVDVSTMQIEHYQRIHEQSQEMLQILDKSQVETSLLSRSHLDEAQKAMNYLSDGSLHAVCPRPTL